MCIFITLNTLGTDEATVIAVTIVVLLFAIIVVLVTVSVVLVYICILRREKMSNCKLKTKYDSYVMVREYRFI